MASRTLRFRPLPLTSNVHVLVDDLEQQQIPLLFEEGDEQLVAVRAHRHFNLALQEPSNDLALVKVRVGDQILKRVQLRLVQRLVVRAETSQKAMR